MRIRENYSNLVDELGQILLECVDDRVGPRQFLAGDVHLARLALYLLRVAVAIRIVEKARL